MKRNRTLVVSSLSAAVALAWALPADPATSSPRAAAEPSVAAAQRSAQPSGERGEPRAPAVARAGIDVDLDGRLELLVTRPDGRVALVRETPGGPLEDRTEALGLATLPPVATALWQDVDGDLAPDLLVLVRDGSVRLLRNGLQDGFDDVTTSSGLGEVAGARAAEWIDVERDGRLELLLTTTSGVRLHRHLGGFLFQGASVELPGWTPVPVVTTAFPAASSEGMPRVAETPGPAAAASRVERDRAPGTARRSTASSAATAAPAPTYGSPTAEALLAGAVCAKSILDQNGGGCLQASSSPALGSLYPLSSNLFVEAGTGYVGVNTTSPGAQLDVETSGTFGIAVTSEAEGPSTAFFSSPNTDPNIPTIVAFTSDTGTAAYFDRRISIGDNFFGFPLDSIVLGQDANDHGELLMKNGRGIETVELLTEEGTNNGAQLELRLDDGTTTISLDAAAGSLSSKLGMHSRSGQETVEILASEAAGNGAQLVMRKDDGIATIVLDAETSVAAEVSLRNSVGLETIEMLTEEVAGDGAQIVLRKADGAASIVLDAEQGANGRITTDTLAITGGADLVESFRTNGECPPGTVMSIDPAAPGELRPAVEPYDVRVAGVVSGAGGVRPGLHLGQRGVLDGDTAIALTGRVYVRCTGEGGAIRPGDLLTTSSTPGCAMRATDRERTPGAVLGKAMGSLEGDGEGLVLVLVGLQ